VLYENNAESQPAEQSQGVTSNPESVLALRLAQTVENHPDLTTLIDAWPDLPQAVRAGIVAMINAAGGSTSEDAS